MQHAVRGKNTTLSPYLCGTYFTTSPTHRGGAAHHPADVGWKVSGRWAKYVTHSKVTYPPTYDGKVKRQLNKPLTCLTVCGSFSHTQFWAMYVSISDAMAAAGGYESWSCSHMSSRTQPARQCTLLTSLFEWNRVVMEAAMFMWMEV